MKDINPFLISGYYSKEFFCDRDRETTDLYSFLKNGNNVTLVSPRRMGKTGLILHAFKKLQKDNICETLYVDIFATKKVEDFIKILSEAILRAFPEKTSIGKQFWEFIKKLRPLFGFDSLTGETTLQITYQTESEKTQTLRNIFHFLEKQEKKIVIAIDEFQQITDYPEGNMEAILRTEIQHLQNVSFIFSGSKRRMMIDMFSNTKRPFYASTSFMILAKIDPDTYTQFIRKHFEKAGFQPDNDALEFVLSWTRSHTYYTQFLCNQLYDYGEKKITLEIVKHICTKILDFNTPTYIQLRELLTKAQWNYLIAVAKEEKVEQINAQNFLMKYKIGTASNSKRLMSTLTERELILDELNLERTTYQIYDVFFYHWLRENY